MFAEEKGTLPVNGDKADIHMQNSAIFYLDSCKRSACEILKS